MTNSPQARRIPYIHQNHGEERYDEFAWLRDDERSDQDVIDYLIAENRWCEQQLAPLSALQETLYAEMTARIPGNDHSVPFLKAGYWYQQRYQQGDDYPRWVWRKDNSQAQWRTLLDCNIRARDAEYYELGALEITADHRYMAVTEDYLSRREYTLRIKDLREQKWLPTVIEGLSPSIVWANDGQTLFYIKQDPQTLLPWQVWRHQLGNDPSQDTLIYEEHDDSFYVSLTSSSSEQRLFILLDSSTVSEAWAIDANNPHLPPCCVLERRANHEYSIDHFEEHYFIRSNRDGINFGLYRCTQDDTSEQNWHEVIPAKKDRILEDFQLFNDWLVTEEREQGIIQLCQYSLHNGQRYTLPKQAENGVVWIGHNPEVNTTRLRFGYSSLTTPTTTYEWDLNTHQLQRLKQVQIPLYDEHAYQSDWRWLTMRDGVKVPVSLVWRRDCLEPGKNPLLVYGYGAYGAVLEADFSFTRQSLLDRGFIYAMVHVRGGGELGRAWYDVGRLQYKMNSFNDFIDATQQLLQQGMGDSKRCYAMGGSAGGLLVAGVSNLAPTLFHGILAQVPFVDVVSTMLDESIPLTTGEYEEWGNPNIKEDYEVIRTYSPYDNVCEQAYPHLFVTTGLHDSQVQYWEPAKWVAKLRKMKTDAHQLLLYTDLDAGHGGKSGRYQAYVDIARECSFLIGLATGEWPKS
ncbi:S9 family peptidase [Rosenbergiella australiborealis]|uniref:S9 family peptidase n=1 Tax=Rosenbergiella australiborealis TaxID=1544696 RepID=A0ABS5T1P9_9GAMM|nr:S9 family peptidase [Rosenbergiella australiborealis]MBT0726275.1 S9 family peptidase [Rosenbergiella australiborealis]